MTWHSEVLVVTEVNGTQRGDHALKVDASMRLEEVMEILTVLEPLLLQTMTGR